MSSRLARSAGLISIATMSSRLLGVAPERVVVLPNALDLDAVLGPVDPARQAALRARCGLDSVPVVGLSVGRLEANKGFTHLLRALAQLPPDVPPWRWLIVGTGQDRAALAQLAGELGLVDAPCWHSSRSRIVTIGGLVAQVSGTLGKIGADVGLLALTGAVAVEGGGASSAMAHKSNPVGAEQLVALAHQNAALVGALHQSMVHENERSGAAWTLEWLTLPQMLRNTGGALRIAGELVGAIRFR